MNNKNLALKISKHPLIRKLMEDRAVPNSVIANLIVEELMEAPAKGEFYVGKKGSPGLRVRNNIKQIMDNAVKKDIKSIQAASKRISNFPETFNIEGVSEEHLEILKKFSAHTVSRGAEQVKILQAAEQAKQTPGAEDDKKVQQAQQKLDQRDTVAVQKVDQALKNTAQQPSQENPYKNMAGYKELNLKPKGETVFVSFLNKLREKNIIKEANLTQLGQAIGTGRGLNDVVKSFEGDNRKILIKLLQRDDVQKFILQNLKDIKQASTALARQELDIGPIAKKFGEYEYFKPLNDEQKKVMFKFIALLKRKELFEGLADKTSLVKTFKALNVKGVGNMEVILQYMTEKEQQAVQDILRDENTSVEKFLNMLKKAEIVPAEKTGEKEQPKPDDTKDAPTAGPQLPINTENTDEFVKASSDFLKEFYRQKYKKNQGIMLDNVIKSLSGMVEDENLAQAAQRVPDKKEKPESDAATTEKKPEETKPPEQAQQDLQEQEEQKQASKDEMRNLRIGMNSLLKRINWSQKALEAYEKTAKAGSVLADADKKKFIKVLQDIQKAIKRICLVLQQILRDTQKLNEEESDTVKEWKEIQKKYDLASEAVSNLAEILKPGGVKEIPKMLTNDAFSALIDLSIHFPSVAPFGAGKDSRRNFEEYKVKFKNAVQKVKDDLQNVFSLMKTGQAGEESLILALDGLKEFSAHIQAIFGVPSEFEELKVEPNEEAAEGESQEDKEPEGDSGDFPRDLPTQIKDTLDEYYGTYTRLKKILAKGLFKESINDDYQALKGALASSKKSIRTIVTGDNYKELIAAGEKQGISRKETASMVGDMMRYFVRVYEELMNLYKRATEEPEEAKKPSWWKNLWPKTLEKFNQLKDIMKDLYDKFEDWLVGKGLDIDITLDADELGRGDDLNRSLSDILKGQNKIKKIIPTNKFQEIVGDTKYYDTFLKTILIMFSKRQVNEVDVGSINGPLAKASPNVFWDQKDFQQKLKGLVKSNQGLARNISQMTRDIATPQMKLLMGIVGNNKDNIPVLNFSEILKSDDFIPAKQPTEKDGIKSPSNLITLLRSKTTQKARMLSFIEKYIPQEASRIQSSLIIWHMMLKQDSQQPIKEQEKPSSQKKSTFTNIFSKIPPQIRKEKGLQSGDISAIQRNLRLYSPEIVNDITKAHNEIGQTELYKIYNSLDEIFGDTKISIPLNNKATIEKFKTSLMSDQKKQPEEEEVDDSLLDSDDLGLTPEEEQVIKDESEKSVKKAQDQNKDASPQEIADAATEEAMSSPGVKEITADMTDEEKEKVSNEIERQSQEKLQSQSGAGAKKEYEEGVKFEFLDEEIEILEEIINFKIPVTEVDRKQASMFYFGELFGKDTFEKFKQKFEGFINTIDEKKFNIIGDFYDKIKLNRDAHKRFKSFYRSRMESQQSSDAPEKPDNKKQSGLEKLVTSSAKEAQKENPKANKKELEKITQQKVLSNDSVEDAIQSDENPKQKKKAIEKKVQILMPPSIFPPKRRSEKEINFLKKAKTIIKNDLRYKDKENKIESISQVVIQDLWGDLSSIETGERYVWPPQSEGTFEQFVKNQGGAKNLYNKMKNKYDWFELDSDFILIKTLKEFYLIDLKSFMKNDFFENNLVDESGEPYSSPPPPEKDIKEQIIANKLKPLIREMLNKGK